AQDAHRAALTPDRVQLPPNGAIDFGPSGLSSVLERVLQTQAVVKSEKGSLPGGAKTALGQGMFRVAFQLDRSAVAALHQHAAFGSACAACGSEKGTRP